MVRVLGCSFILALVAACGGGGGSDKPTTANPGPQLALLVSNGHSPLAPNYLSGVFGPQLESALGDAGYSVQTTYYTDDPSGYQAFLDRLRAIRDDWIVDRDDPTRVVVVGHSHGGVRAHAAMRAVPDCPIRLLVDLDSSSFGWDLVHNDDIGGGPAGAYDLGVSITCPEHPGVASASTPYDLEDVVFDQVVEALDVRSGDPAIEYDRHWNARTDGGTDGLWCHFAGTQHNEVVNPLGNTFAFVRDWILDRLATD